MTETGRETVTHLLRAWAAGEDAAADALLDTIYPELRRLAAAALRRERPGHTLQPTALVHEAYLRLVDQHAVEWQSRGHFFALAARMIRRILVDHARRRGYAKRGGNWVRVSFAGIEPTLFARGEAERPQDLVALDDALRRLAEIDEAKAKLVELRYFGGLQVQEIAELEGLSTATVNRRWRAARAWLFQALKPEDSAADSDGEAASQAGSERVP